ncbi:hypothetical protein AAC530_002802 [Listeria monocytogenes]|uniref:hypothetical protein n=1 Tax=Listeria monocytogenes TaxID=1639 RepID=UPI000C85F6EC|nr:hypothetical protein [Listeria monocytogenes]EAE8567877.1 hypothetical protein [Listeria monocytogenes]EAF6962934.1 hypothetical protein [Listeria monocytogenes]EAF8119771.1 hypothetical protein [Listeria monocytogenes]EDO0419924.1 hypothetical protein [Listeria monocytogenes]EHF6226508.1 hypothetical protein [Listeria monocytogenes]
MEKLKEALLRLQVIQGMTGERGTNLSLDKVVDLISSHIEEQKPKPNPETEQKKASPSFQ